MLFLGHPIHPMLVHFPIAFWSAGTACDGFTLLGLNGAWPQAWLFIAIGLATAVPAMVAGVLDFAGLEASSASTGRRHMLLMGTTWSMYFAAFVARSDGWAPVARPEWLPIALSAAGFVLMVVGGRDGGALVYRHGVGVKRQIDRL